MDILVVDDDPGTCETLALGLRKLGGHDVATATSADAGLAMARSRTFDIVLLDKRLGAHDGLEVLGALRHTRSAAAAIYLFTAWGTIQDAVEAMRRGAADYLEKQRVDVEQLVQMFGHTPTPTVPTDPRIRIVVTMIADNPIADPECLAAAVNLSVSRLRALFRVESGVPLKKHQRLARLERGAFLLRTTYRRISEVAQALQFNDPKRFERLFRARFGLSPSEYVQSRRPNR